MKEVLTREERTERIMEIYDKLDDAGKSDLARKIYEQYIEQKMGELDKLLGRQAMPYGVIGETFYKYFRYKLNHEKYDNQYENELMRSVDIFNYGRICGIRQERARRRGIDF
jgi:hypothetical protein